MRYWWPAVRTVATIAIMVAALVLIGLTLTV